jgi:periplasmic copper chaperone A
LAAARLPSIIDRKDQTMTNLAFRTAAAGALMLFTLNTAQAQEYKEGNLTIGHPWVRPTAEGQKEGAAYLSIKDNGREADRLVSAESPVAEKIELHKSVEEGGVMKMLSMKSGIEVEPGSTVEFKPGGYHVMLIGLKQSLKEGEMIPLTLTFAKAGSVKVEAKVEKSSSAMSEKHM